MAEFFVHWNTIVKKVRIHRAACGACKNGAGMHEGKIAAARGSTYDWEPADSYADAQAIVAALQKSKPILLKSRGNTECGLCHPGRQR